MSGIAVVWGTQDDAPVRKMLTLLQHRGTDAGFICTGEEAVLGYTSQNQDKEIFYANGKEAIVCDGVIVPDTDPQHLLNSISGDEPAAALSRIEGSFALVAQTRNGPVAARDRFGQKPLYYGRGEGNETYMASELKSLADFCSEIKPLPPGTLYRPGTDTAPVPFCNGEAGIDEETTTKTQAPESIEDAKKQLQDLMVKAVEQRIPQKGNVGIFLSGGLDSSIIAAIARQLTVGPIKTFTAGYEGSLDLHHARVVADYLNAEHTEYLYTLNEMLLNLPQVIYHLESFDWSLVRSSIANYIVARLAREHNIDFVLVGEGADELFGGYHYIKDKKPEEQIGELKKLISAGHNIGFQRVDRMTSAHTLETAMPFMDEDIIRLAAAMPMEWKIHGPEREEKWILRAAFEGWLPDSIIHRRKDEFSQGAGSANVLEEMAEEKITAEEFALEREPFPGYKLISKEELFYYRIFRRFFPQQSLYETVGHWQPY